MIDFTKPLNTEHDARMFIRNLVKADRHFHFDDDPALIINWQTNERAFSDEEVPYVRARVAEVTELLERGEPFDMMMAAISTKNGETLSDPYEAS